MDNLQYLFPGEYTRQDFTALDQVANFRYLVGSVEPEGYDIRAMAVSPLLTEHNYQIVTGAVLNRTDTSVSSDMDFKSY